MMLHDWNACHETCAEGCPGPEKCRKTEKAVEYTRCPICGWWIRGNMRVHRNEAHHTITKVREDGKHGR